MIFQAGQTVPDQKLVIGNIFQLVDSQGLPLEIILHYFKEHDLVPAWDDFIDRTLDAGWNLRSTISKILTAVSDIYGREVMWETEFRIRLYIVSLDK